MADSVDAIVYALGTSPDFPTVYSRSNIEMVDHQPILSMTLPRGIVPPDAQLLIEVSTDPAVWVPATIIEQSDVLIKAGDPVVDAVAGTSSRFIRARVAIGL